MIISLSSLKISNLHNIPHDFYGSPNEQHWMCELCTFSQIWSHIMYERCSVVSTGCLSCLWRYLPYKLGLGDSTIVIHCRDSRSTIVMMIVLFTIVIVVDMIFE